MLPEILGGAPSLVAHHLYVIDSTYVMHALFETLFNLTAQHPRSLCTLHLQKSSILQSEAFTPSFRHLR